MGHSNSERSKVQGGGHRSQVSGCRTQGSSHKILKPRYRIGPSARSSNPRRNQLPPLYCSAGMVLPSHRRDDDRRDLHLVSPRTSGLPERLRDLEVDLRFQTGSKLGVVEGSPTTMRPWWHPLTRSDRHGGSPGRTRRPWGRECFGRKEVLVHRRERWTTPTMTSSTSISSSAPDSVMTCSSFCCTGSRGQRARAIFSRSLVGSPESASPPSVSTFDPARVSSIAVVVCTTPVRPPTSVGSSTAFSIEAPGRRLAAAGVSLGGNVLLKYLGENGSSARARRSGGVVGPFRSRGRRTFHGARLRPPLRRPPASFAQRQSLGPGRTRSAATSISNEPSARRLSGSSTTPPPLRCTGSPAPTTTTGGVRAPVHSEITRPDPRHPLPRRSVSARRRHPRGRHARQPGGHTGDLGSRRPRRFRLGLRRSSRRTSGPKTE